MSVQTFEEHKHPRAADGRFTVSSSPEADVDLDPRVAEDWSGNGTVDDEAVLSACRKYARITGSRYRVDPSDVDDLAGETALHWTRYLTNRREKVASGTEDPKPEFNYERHIGHIATGLGQRYASGMPNGGRDLTALTKWLKTREEFETRYGRPMSHAEEDELADQIRTAAPPGRRPVDGFHRLPSMARGVSLDALRQENTSFEPQVRDAPETPETQDNDAQAHDALDIVETGGRGSTAAAKRALWGVMAAGTDAPDVQRGTVSESEARRTRDEMGRLGGASGVVERYGRAEETEEDMEALLRPWGGTASTTVDQRDAIVEALERDPKYTDDVWDAALYTATAERSRS